MSARSQKKNPKLDLKLNLLPPRTHSSDNEDDHDPQVVENPSADPLSSPSSCNSSCLSSTAEDQTVGYNTGACDNPDGSQAQVTIETTTSSMVVLGCPRCLMYVMLYEVEPRCPRCKSTVLLDLISEDLNAKKKTT